MKIYMKLFTNNTWQFTLIFHPIQVNSGLKGLRIQSYQTLFSHLYFHFLENIQKSAEMSAVGTIICAMQNKNNSLL